MESYYYLIEIEDGSNYVSERVLIIGSFVQTFDTFFSNSLFKEWKTTEDHVKELILSNKNPKEEITLPERRIKRITKVFMSLEN